MDWRVLRRFFLALVIAGGWWVVTGGAKSLDEKMVVVFPLTERGRSGIGDQVALLRLVKMPPIEIEPTSVPAVRP